MCGNGFVEKLMVAPFTPPGTRKVAQLPPAGGIADPAARAFAEAVTNLLNVRSGDVPKAADQRFITSAEFDGLVGGAVVGLFSKGVRAFGAPVPGSNPNAAIQNPDALGQIAAMRDAFQTLGAAIRSTLLYEILGTQFQLPQVDALQQKFDKDLKAQGFSVQQTITAQKGLVTRVDGIAAAVDDAVAAIDAEETVRATDDLAIARAIKTIWASIGGTDAIIQEGNYTGATPNSAVASKWNTVVAAVTDPNTGNVNSASIKEQLESYANLVNSALTSQYSVRAQLNTSGRVIVGGFGLTAIAGGGSGTGGLANDGSGHSIPGSQIAFGVRADTFFVEAPGTGTPAWDVTNPPLDVPFAVLTSATTIGGVLYDPGVYASRAKIFDAQIGTAAIASAAITTAKIGSLAVTTLKIGDNAVTIPTGAQQAGSIALITGGSETWKGVASVSLTYASGEVPSHTLVQCTGNCVGPGSGSPFSVNLGLFVNGTLYQLTADSMNGDWATTPCLVTIIPSAILGAGSHTLEFSVKTQQTGIAGTFQNGVIAAVGMKK